MKTLSLTVALFVVLGSATCAWASDKTKESKSKSKSPPPQQTEQTKGAQAKVKKDAPVTVTGSYIKRDLKRNGMIVEGPSPLYVIDSQSIRTSGAVDLNQLLIQRGFKR